LESRQLTPTRNPTPTAYEKERASVCSKVHIPKMTYQVSGDEVQSLVPIIREAFSHQIGSQCCIDRLNWQGKPEKWISSFR